MMTLRIAREQDAERILAIYAPYIQQTSLTFETEVPAIPAFAERINDYLINWPWLVAETDGVIAGYAYGTRYRERTAYQWSVESSVYIHNDHQRTGLGRALYTALFELLKKQGFYNVYAVINLPNGKSVLFHERCGFSWFATYEKVGYKLGEWKNVGWWKLGINEYIDDPPAPLKFAEMDKNFIASVLESAESLLKL
jgi:L-amino acid N-acyltransferase YncA